MSALVLLVQLTVLNAQASPFFSFDLDTKFKSLVCSIKLTDAPAVWQKLRTKLDARLSDGDRYVSRLLVKSDKVERIITELGAGHMGHVYSVQTTMGRMALKLYPKTILHEQMSRPILIQQVLGALGMAPKLNGVLSAEEVALLVRKFPELKQHSFGYGILMEEIKYSWDSKSTKLPADRTFWDHDRMVHRLDQISEALNSLGILSQDEQILITKYGRIYLSDFDLYSWVKPNSEFENELLEKERFRRLKRQLNNIR